MRSEVKVVLMTGPDPETLRELGRRLVTDRLAACVNVVDGVRSIYRWRGEVESDDESLAFVKTTAARMDELERRIGELHPYEEPEVVALDVSGGSSSYLDWVAGAVERRS